MIKKAFFLLFLCISLLFSACSHPIPKHAIEVFVESPKQSSARGMRQQVVMPVSGARLSVVSTPVIGTKAFTNSEVYNFRHPILGDEVQGIRLRQKDDAWLKVFQISGEAIGKHFLLVVDGRPIGYYPIRKQIRKDELFFIIESRKSGAEFDKELKELNSVLNDYILEYREYNEAGK